MFWMVPNKTVCGISGLISITLICIYHQVTPDYICGLVLHFSVYQLKNLLLMTCESDHVPLPGLFPSKLVVFLAILDFAVCPEAFLHKIERKKHLAYFSL